MKGKPITDQEWETILQTLAPYLQRGLPVYKACIEAKIPYSTVYKRMREDEGSMQRIEALKNFKQVAYSDFILRRFLEIYNKSNSGQPISKEDMKFIYWTGVVALALLDTFVFASASWASSATTSLEVSFSLFPKSSMMDFSSSSRGMPI